MPIAHGTVHPPGCAGFGGPVIATSRTHLFTCYHYMFINIPCRTSDCVERMVVDPLRAVVQVAYRKGNIYEYTCVSRRAIASPFFCSIQT